MAVTVLIPTPLRKFTDDQAEVQAEGSSVGEVLTFVTDKHPGLAERILDDKGKVRRFVNLFANDEDVRFLDNLETELSDGDELSIVPAIAGGH
ncbi:MAG: ubiquitin-like small modifier protein 1 [Myxococcota bacterium]